MSTQAHPSVHRKNFTIVPNEIILDKRLNSGARLLLIYHIYKNCETDLLTASNDLGIDLDAIDSYAQELISLGLLIVKGDN